ncbi:MAG: sigma-70 family RNA polymerase sigma factor [Myxococcota bacterium]
MSDSASAPRALLARIAHDRDRDAFAELFRRFAPRIKGYMGRSGAPTDQADELVQEAMLRVWRHAASFDPERGSVEAWLFRIVRNARLDQIGRQQRHAIDPADPALLPAEPDAPDTAVAGRQRSERLRLALAGLPAEQAAALRSIYYGFKTMQAAAEEQGVAVGTLKSRVRLGCNHLRSALVREEL